MKAVLLVIYLYGNHVAMEQIPIKDMELCEHVAETTEFAKFDRTFVRVRKICIPTSY